MCGRFFFTSPLEAMRQLFKVQSGLNLQARYNIAPTQDILVYSIQDEIGPCLVPMRWGMVPSWIKEIPQTAVFNARAETINQKPYFKGGFRHHRCLIPANGWYEWAKLDGAKKPYKMTIENDAPMVFAGVSDTWTGPDGNSFVLSASIVTRPALGPLEPVHSRMPLLLNKAGMAAWMDHRNHRPPDPLDRALLPDLDRITITLANPAVGNVRNDGAHLLTPDQNSLGL